MPAEERGETAMPRNNAAAMNVLPFYYKPWHIDGRRPSLSVVEGSVAARLVRRNSRLLRCNLGRCRHRISETCTAVSVAGKHCYSLPLTFCGHVRGQPSSLLSSNSFVHCVPFLPAFVLDNLMPIAFASSISFSFHRDAASYCRPWVNVVAGMTTEAWIAGEWSWTSAREVSRRLWQNHGGSKGS